jgi:hypothetical protein
MKETSFLFSLICPVVISRVSSNDMARCIVVKCLYHTVSNFMMVETNEFFYCTYVRKRSIIMDGSRHLFTEKIVL